jgi:SAM-dependent methyltransferase
METASRFDKVRRYYDGFDEWSRLDSPAGALEFERTLGVLEEWLSPGSRVLDLGGGPGRYAIALASAGHQVALADLSEVLLATARENIERAGVANNVESVETVNACDLGLYDSESFDAVLALGPFYHLCLEADRAAAAREIARVLRPDGLLAAAFIPRVSGLVGLFYRAAMAPAQVTPEALERTARDGVFQNASERGFQEGYYALPEEFAELFEGCGLQKEALISIRGIAYGQEQHLAQIREQNPALYDTFLRLIGETQSDPAVLATSGHALFLGRKTAG